MMAFKSLRLTLSRMNSFCSAAGGHFTSPGTVFEPGQGPDMGTCLHL